MTDAVLADAQFGVARVLRPFSGFESVYQGQPGETPILIPGNLASEAGKPGYSPNLIAGHPVPLGSKLMVWFPTILDGTTIVSYSFSIVWRLRNIQDFRGSRAAYHFPKQSLGAGKRYVLPAGKKTVLYESATSYDNVSGSYRNDTVASLENFQLLTNLKFPALTPNGQFATLQQGLGGAPDTNATFNVVQMDAEGDEMLFLVTARSPSGLPRDWDFSPSGRDYEFSKFFGNAGVDGPYPDLGVYVFTGSNP